MFAFMTVMAQAGSGGSGSEGGAGAALMFPLIAAMVVFFFIMMRGNRATQKKKDAMLNNMKKNDRVMTIGGVVGTIFSVGENEVVLKVDEASNTKMTFIKRAIQQVIAEDADLSAANREQR